MCGDRSDDRTDRNGFNNDYRERIFDAFSGLLIGLFIDGSSDLLSPRFLQSTDWESVTKRDLAVIKQAFERPDVDRLIDENSPFRASRNFDCSESRYCRKQEEVGYEIINEISRDPTSNGR